MDLYKIISTWAGAFIAAFEQHLFVSAIATLAAVIVYGYLHRKSQVTPLSVFLLIVGWLIIVPITGTILDSIGWIFTVAATLMELLVEVYNLYVSQPFWVIGYLLASIVLYLAWPRLQHSYRPVFRVGGPILLFLALTFLTVPVLNQFTGDNPPDKMTEVEKKDIQH